MPILKETYYGASNVPVSFHVLIKADMHFKEGFALLGVVSFVTEADYLAGKQQACSWQHSVHLNEFVGLDSISDNLEHVLTQRPDLPFYGGQLVVDNGDTVQAARERAWVAVKAARTQALAGSFTFEGGVYQINKEDMTGAAVAAYLTKASGQPYSKDWTLTDNTVRALSADQVVAMGLVLDAHIDAIYAKARHLRALIESAATSEEASAVTWRAYNDTAPFASLLS
jgi:hypothetical protein